MLCIIFRRVHSLQYEHWFAFIPFVNIYILTTKICHFSDRYFILMVVLTLLTVIGGVILYFFVLITLGKLFNHSKCWSFFLLCLFPIIGLGIIVLKNEYYRWDDPILEPPDAVFQRVSDPVPRPRHLPSSLYANNANLHYFVVPVANEDVYLKNEEDPNNAHKSHNIPIPYKNPEFAKNRGAYSVPKEIL